MNRNLFFPCLLVIGVAFFASCGNKNKYAIAVPKDAAFVFHINSPSIASKLSWAEIKASSWFQQIRVEDDDTLAKTLLDNPDNSGINTQEAMVFFMKKRGDGGYITFQGTLKDAAAFEAFCKKMDKKDLTVTKDGDLSIIKDKNGIVTWNSSRFMFLGDAPFMGVRGDMMNPGRYPDPHRFPADSLVKFAKELYALNSDESLFDDKRFAELIKEPGDAHMWASAEHSIGGGVMLAATFFSKIDKLFKGNVTAGVLNFDNGKISVKSKSYMNDELNTVFKKYGNKNVDAATINRIPSQNVVALWSMHYNPESLPELLKVLELDGPANGFLSKFEYSVPEFVKANKGEVLLAVTDLEMKSQTVDIPGMEKLSEEQREQLEQMAMPSPNVKILFASSINDKMAFEKLVAVIKNHKDEIPITRGFPDFDYSMNDQWFAAGNNLEQVNKFLEGGNNNLPIASRLSGRPLVFYVDLQKAMVALGNVFKDARFKAALDESRKMWEDILMTGGEFKDGAFTSQFDINLVDKNTNSLKQLNQYIDRIIASKNSVAAN